MRNDFRGWRTIYGFTLRQATKGAGFKFVTSLVTILILAAFIIINIVVAKPEKEGKIETSPIKKVYVLDNSGLQETNYKEFILQLSLKGFEKIDFVTSPDKSSDEAVRSAASDSPKSIAVIISKEDSAYELKGIIPEGSEIKKKHVEALLEPMSSAFESNKLMQAGLSEAQLMSVLKPAVVSFSEVGESTSEISKAIKMIAPMIFSFMLYFMLLIHGQTVSKSISAEKTSKLMEVLLTSVHPYALITGKVLAITTMAVGQFVTWIITGVVGLYGGNAIAHALYPEYENSVITIINFLRDNIGETSLAPSAVILAVIFFFIGFLFYCVLAALAGSMVSKPEDISSTQSIFQLPVIFSWLVVYFAPLMDKEKLMTAARYIPFTSPFSVPIDLITGTMGLFQGIISMAILLVICLLVIILSARIYKGLVLYNGENLSLKKVGNILKGNK